MKELRTFVRGRKAVVALLATILATPAGPALAAGPTPSPGVHVDPGSPAAKEYQIPLGAARGNGQSGGSNSSQLFGAGITHGGSGGNGATANSPAAGTSPAAATSPPASGTTGAAGGTTGASTASARAPVAGPTSNAARHPQRRHHRSAGARQIRQSGKPVAAAPPPVSPQRAIGTDSSAGIGITWMLGAAVIVLLLGALGGTVLARRGRRTSPHPS